MDNEEFDLLQFEKTFWVVPDDSAREFIVHDWAKHLADRGGLITGRSRELAASWRRGRSYQNLAKRADARIATKRVDLPATRESLLIKSATEPQELLNPKFLKAAKYLKYGGPIMLVLGAGLSAREIASASKEDRGRVAMEETGSFIGGELASGVAFSPF